MKKKSKAKVKASAESIAEIEEKFEDFSVVSPLSFVSF